MPDSTEATNGDAVAVLVTMSDGFTTYIHPAAAREIERLRERDKKLRDMLAQMKTEAEGSLYGYPHWLEQILNG